MAADVSCDVASVARVVASWSGLAAFGVGAYERVAVGFAGWGDGAGEVGVMGWTDLDRYRMLPPQFITHTRSAPDIFDPAVNAAAGMRYIREHYGQPDQARESRVWYGRFDAGSPTAVWSRSPMIFDAWDRHRRPWWARVLAWGIAAYCWVKR